MKMKRLLLMPLMALCFASATSCSTNVEKYYLDAGGSFHLSPDFPKSGYYKVNQKISFKVMIVTDVTFYPFLNDEMLKSYKSDERLGGYEYYTFNMPGRDSVLAVSSNRFYANREYSFSEIFYTSYILDNRDKVKTVIINEINDENDGATKEIARSEKQSDIDYNIDIIANAKLVKTGNGEIQKKNIDFRDKDGNRLFSMNYDPVFIYREWAYSQCFAFASDDAPSFAISE